MVNFAVFGAVLAGGALILSLFIFAGLPTSISDLDSADYGDLSGVPDLSALGYLSDYGFILSGCNLWLPMDEGSGSVLNNIGVLGGVCDVYSGSWVSGYRYSGMFYNSSYSNLGLTRDDLSIIDDFSVSFWCNSSLVDSDWHIVMGDWGGVGSGRTFHVGQWNNKKLEVSTHLDGSQYDAFCDFDVVEGVWYHVVAVLEMGVNLRIYVNSVLNGSCDVTGTSAFTDSGSITTFKLGNRGDGGTVFVGVVDSLRVYNRVLSGYEIEALYGLGV